MFRTRGPGLAAVLLAALCLCGCGSADDRAAPRPPRLPRALAAALASQSDEIAQALDAGDPCRASRLARALQAQTISAINARRVAGPFQEQLAATVTDLATRIQCVPQPKEKQGHGHGKEKGKGKHGGDD